MADARLTEEKKNLIYLKIAAVEFAPDLFVHSNVGACTRSTSGTATHPSWHKQMCHLTFHTQMHLN